MKCYFLLIVMAVLPLVANAYDAEIDGIYYNFSGIEATVTYKKARDTNPRYTSDYSGAVVIPASVIYDNLIYTVTSISDNAFYGCKNLTSLNIPKSVTSIGSNVIWGCHNLSSIVVASGNPKYDSRDNCNAIIETSSNTLIAGNKSTIIPNSVTRIGERAFYNCTSLTSITIPSSVTSIDSYAFSSCSGLTSITIPNSVTSIGNSAFSYCSGLTSVTIPNGVTSIGDYAFSWCSGLTSITIPNSVTSIGELAFNDCTRLTSISIPNSVTSISIGAFSGCSGLTSIIIPNSVTNIAHNAFSGCSKLTSIVVASGNPKYDSRDNCNAIIETSSNTLIAGCKSTVIPNSVTGIGYYAFFGCSDLTSITIPSSVTSIDYNAFDGCSDLTAVHITDIAAWCNISFRSDASNPLFYAKHLYLNDEEIKDLVIPNGVTSIGAYAFSSCSGLTSITIPSSVIDIGYRAFEGTIWYNNQPDGLIYIGKVAYRYKGEMPSGTHVTIEEGTLSISGAAFYGCSGLTSVNIPNSVTSIGNSAFYECSGLTSVNIPNSVTSIGNSAFYECSGLTSIIFPNSVASIGSGAFYGCSGLTSVNIPNSVTSIGSSTFAYCSNLTSIIIPNSVTSIGSSTFYKCSSLTSINIPDGVTNIGDYAFYECSGLTSIIIPNSVASIGSGAFYGCSGLTSVNIPNSVTSIGNSTFYKCSSLTSINIPDGVTSTGDYAFYDCSGLTSITIPNSITSIGDAAFEFCTSLRSIIIPNSVTSIGKAAFYECTRLTSVTIGTSVVCIGSFALPQTAKIYTSAGKTLLRLWNAGYSGILEKETGRTLSFPQLSFATTASSITTSVSNGYPEFSNAIEAFGTSYAEGESITGLDPNTLYNGFSLTLSLENVLYTLLFNSSVKTQALTLTTQQPKVISAGNVIVAATSNLDDAEGKVGFEWRRYDWPDDIASNVGVAYLYEGSMEGYIRNLYTEKFWRFRPYYESNTGNRYYGDWVAFDPTNTNYFEPTVHTYAQITVQGNSAEVKGYVMRGTDNVASQGFMYWPNNTSFSFRKKAASIPDNVIVVRASGNVMTATLEDLEYETTYCYVAFVTTSEGETFYGETQTFSTSVDPDGIREIKNEELRMKNEGVWYSLDGRKIDKPQKGINIIRYADGTSKKVLIK